MKTSFVASILLGAVSVFAQVQLSDLPDCAMQCGVNAIGQTKCSGGVDPKCICPNEAFIKTIKECVIETCGDDCDKRKKTLDFAEMFCDGHDLNTAGFGKGCSNFPKELQGDSTATGTAASATETSDATGTSAAATSSSTNAGTQNTFFNGAVALVALAAAAAL